MTSTPKRYYIIDFQAAILYIKPDEYTTKEKDIKQIFFRDIIDVYLPKTDLKT